MSTQSMVQKLFVDDARRVIEPPVSFAKFKMLYAKGYQYLFLDPQAYVSFTDDGWRFTPRLKGYLGFIHDFVKPIRIYPHFNKALLERFVLEHNENLERSLVFLTQNPRHEPRGALFVYDVKECLAAIEQAVSSQHLKFSNQDFENFQ